jgi:hypothetical protein
MAAARDQMAPLHCIALLVVSLGSPGGRLILKYALASLAGAKPDTKLARHHHTAVMVERQ